MGATETKSGKWYPISHLIIGISTLIIFAYTGQVMDKEYAHLDGMADIPRMTFRAGHIYILLSGIIHLALGFSKLGASLWFRLFQILGSLLLLTGTFLFVYSWFTELPSDIMERPLAREAIWMSLRGGVIIGIMSLIGMITGKTK